MLVDRPLSIRLFAILFGAAAALSLLLALHAARSPDFGIAITPEAAETLAWRILPIRLMGGLFALSLMALVLFARSRPARAALVWRWLLGMATSVAFLHGVGLIPLHANGMFVMTLSVTQLLLEGFAIALLYGPDAGAWFKTRIRY